MNQKRKKNLSVKKKRRIARRIIEFLIIGVGFGLTEDLLAVFLVTGEQITWRIFLIVLIVAIPFAIISEILVDSSEFKFLKKIFPKKVLKELNSINNE